MKGLEIKLTPEIRLKLGNKISEATVLLKAIVNFLIQSIKRTVITSILQSRKPHKNDFLYMKSTIPS